jgi:hypothetical protein
MALPSAQQVAAKWAQRAGAAAQDFVTGAQQTDKDPTALAIAAIPRMRAQVIAAIDTGKVAAGLRRSGKQGWLDGITGKGAANYSAGVSAAQGKVEAAFGSLLSFEQALLGRLATMPSNTDAERDARALFWIQGMRGYVKPGS